MDSNLPTTPCPPVLPALTSPLMFADRLLTLAQDADRAGYATAATHLVTAMYAVLDTGSPVRH